MFLPCVCVLINQIYADGEQDPERTHKKFLLVRQEGNRSVPMVGMSNFKSNYITINIICHNLRFLIIFQNNPRLLTCKHCPSLDVI